jgi:hypothetical protein
MDSVGRLVAVSGTVTQTSDVRPELLVATFSCNKNVDCWLKTFNNNIIIPIPPFVGIHDVKIDPMPNLHWKFVRPNLSIGLNCECKKIPMKFHPEACLGVLILSREMKWWKRQRQETSVFLQDRIMMLMAVVIILVAVRIMLAFHLGSTVYNVVAARAKRVQ